MYGSIDRDKLNYPGQFTLGRVFALSYRSVIPTFPVFMDISDNVLEINIYEGLDKSVITGNIVINDSQNITTHLPLTGFERLDFKVFTPGCSRGYDFTRETGSPVYIYSITDRQGDTARNQKYILNFCSKELIRNEQTKVKRAYEGKSEGAIFNIVRQELDSKKPLFLEKTRSNHKYVIPKLRPLNAIQMIAEGARPANHNAPGMVFYEDANGFHLRSYENMLAINSQKARPAVANFIVKVAGAQTPKQSIVEKMQQVNSFAIKKQFDTLSSYQKGVMCNRMITHDMFTKTFDELDFNYNDEYGNFFHTEHDGDGNKQRTKSSVAPLLKYGNDKFSTEHPEAVVMFHSTTTKTHNNFEGPESEIDEPRRISYQTAFRSMVLELEIPGFTGLSVGDIIVFNHPNYEPANKSNPSDRDRFMSGRYLVSKVRHQFSTVDSTHSTMLECIKDSVMNKYPEESTDTFNGKEKDNSKDNIIQEQLDNAVIETASMRPPKFRRGR